MRRVRGVLNLGVWLVAFAAPAFAQGGLADAPRANLEDPKEINYQIITQAPTFETGAAGPSAPKADSIVKPGPKIPGFDLSRLRFLVPEKIEKKREIQGVSASFDPERKSVHLHLFFTF